MSTSGEVLPKSWLFALSAQRPSCGGIWEDASANSTWLDSTLATCRWGGKGCGDVSGSIALLLVIIDGISIAIICHHMPLISLCFCSAYFEGSLSTNGSVHCLVYTRDGMKHQRVNGMNLSKSTDPLIGNHLLSGLKVGKYYIGTYWETPFMKKNCLKWC
jgi:hypothetical protein